MSSDLRKLWKTGRRLFNPEHQAASLARDYKLSSLWEATHTNFYFNCFILVRLNFRNLSDFQFTLAEQRKSMKRINWLRKKLCT